MPRAAPVTMATGLEEGALTVALILARSAMVRQVASAWVACRL
jgi:hypothetical protein